MRRFAVVGLIATAVDVGLAVALLDRGWSVVTADIVALAAAAVVARPLHRVVTLRDDPFARWIRIRRVFVSVVVAAGLVDLAVLALVGTPGGPGRDLVAKVLAVAAAAIVRGMAYRAFLFRVIRREQDRPVPRPPAVGEVRVSVVLPAFREADRIADAVGRVLEWRAPGLLLALGPMPLWDSP